MPGVNTALEALKRSMDTQQVTFTTTTLSGNQSHQISLKSDDSKIDSINYKPSDAGVPTEGIIFFIRPIVNSGSTDSDFEIYESEDREDINQVISITGLNTNDSPETFQPAGGQGIVFQNQKDEEKMYLTITENSGNDSVYQIRLRWFDVTD